MFEFSEPAVRLPIIFKRLKTSLLLETAPGVNEKKCAVMQKILDKAEHPVLYCFLTICP